MSLATILLLMVCVPLILLAIVGIALVTLGDPAASPRFQHSSEEDNDG